MRTLEDLAGPDVARISIANPDHAPYGKAAREALESAGLWDQLQSKLVPAENVRQAFQFAETGNVDVGLVALSLVVRAGGTYALVPEDLHQPINQALAIIASSTHQSEAEQFVAFLTGEVGREILQKYGFVLPEEASVGWQAFLISIQVTVVATLMVVIVGTAAGLLLARVRFPGIHVFEAVLMLPLVLPPSVVGYYLLRFFGDGGPVEGLFGVNIVFTWVAAVFASAVVALPLMVQAARTAIRGVDPVLENAARTLGSSEAAVFLRVTLPLARRGLIAGTVLSAARALGEFGATLMVAGNIPGSTQTLPLFVYDAVQNQQYGVANLVVALLTGMGLVSFIIIGRLDSARNK